MILPIQGKFPDISTRESKRKFANMVAREFITPFTEDVFLLRQIVLKLCLDAATSFSTYISDLISTFPDDDMSWVDELGSTFIDPMRYANWEDYAKDSQLVAFVKKLEPRDSEVNVKESAKVQCYQSFIDAELKCAETNDIFKRRDHLRDPRVASILHTSSRIVADIMRSPPTMAELPIKFGPGSTYSVSGKNKTSSVFKLDSYLDATSDCLDLAVELLQSCPGWLSSRYNDGEQPSEASEISKLIRILPGDRLGTVPKTRKTDRPIAVGPTVNVLIQKGLGGFLRKRFKTSVNIKTAQETHKRLARKASVDRSLCTIDLSAASDTISRGFVEDQVPSEWFDILDASRSKCYRAEDGKRFYEYQKFSAMGNGFTFELESILFYALAKSVAISMKSEGPISVYGDDIIMPNECYGLMCQVLSTCGFTPNLEKSYHLGSFRESCGGDYFNGVDVRPFYMKSDYMTYKSIFLFHNWLVRSGFRYLYRKTFSYIRKKILRSDCLSVFEGTGEEGDGHLFIDTVKNLPAFSVQSKVRYKDNLSPDKRLGLTSFKEYDKKGRLIYKNLHTEGTQNGVELALALYRLESEVLPVFDEQLLGYLHRGMSKFLDKVPSKYQSTIAYDFHSNWICPTTSLWEGVVANDPDEEFQAISMRSTASWFGKPY